MWRVGVVGEHRVRADEDVILDHDPGRYVDEALETHVVPDDCVTLDYCVRPDGDPPITDGGLLADHHIVSGREIPARDNIGIENRPRADDPPVRTDGRSRKLVSAHIFA